MNTTLYRLSVDIDGFGGKDKDKFFYTYQAAVNSLKNHAGFFYDEENGVWDIEGMKETVTSDRFDILDDEDSSDDFFRIKGIPYPENEEDVYCINWAEATIIKMEIPGKPLNHMLYVLKKCDGYNTWLFDGFRETDIPGTNPSNKAGNKEKRILTTFSKSYARKYARAKLKTYPRLWNNKEDKDLISPIGAGRDYLSIEKFVIETKGLSNLSADNVDAVFNYCIADFPNKENHESKKDLLQTDVIVISPFLFSKKRLETMKPYILWNAYVLRRYFHGIIRRWNEFSKFL